MESSTAEILTALPWFAWIPIVAIIGGTFSGVLKMMIVHRERMAMIRQGIHPDALTAKPHEPADCELA
jgi:hypothetical protein